MSSRAWFGRNGDCGPLVTEAETEARGVLDAAGIDYISEAEEGAARAAGFTVKPVPGITSSAGGSTWQSLQRGTGDIETDYLNGEIVMIAHQLEMPTPTMSGSPYSRAEQLPPEPSRAT